MDTAAAFLLVILSGIGTGTVAWPMKVIRKLEFEQFWFIGMLCGLVVIPWSCFLFTVPQPMDLLKAVGWKPLLLANFWGLGWGIANVLYGLCILRIGAALTGSILTGLGIAVGVTMPLVLKGSGLFSQAPGLLSSAGITVLCGVGVILAGVVGTARAGFAREQALHEQSLQPKGTAGSFLGGLIMVSVSGILSAGMSLSFVYGQGPIIQALDGQGVGVVPQQLSVWALVFMGAALVNLLYPACLMTARGSWGRLFVSGKDGVLAAIIGVQFIVSVALMGRGMILLGVLGASVGFGIQQALQVLGNQGVGFVSGEWKGVFGKPRRQMYWGVGIILMAVSILAYANTL